MITEKFAQNDEDRAFLVRIHDLARRASSRGRYEFTDFITPHERALAEADTRLSALCGIDFDGGFDGALRTVAVLSPFDAAYTQAPPLSVLNIDYVWGRPSNRDLLGALMGLGIKRSLIGDIADSAQPPFIVCLDRIADYICDNLTSAGRNSIKLCRGEIVTLPQENAEERTVNVASMRLDCIVSEVFSVSRSAAAQLISAGAVQKNYIVSLSPSAQVREGDVVSARGYGKARVEAQGGYSRKGRIFLEVKILR